MALQIGDGCNNEVSTDLTPLRQNGSIHKRKSARLRLISPVGAVWLVRICVTYFLLALSLCLLSEPVEASNHPTPAAAARACKPQAKKGATPQAQTDKFVDCWNKTMMSPPQRVVEQCARKHMPTKEHADIGQFALCAQGVEVPPKTVSVMTCVGRANGGLKAAASCAASAQLTTEQVRTVGCIETRMVPQGMVYEEFAGSGVEEGSLKGRPL